MRYVVHNCRNKRNKRKFATRIKVQVYRIPIKNFQAPASMCQKKEQVKGEVPQQKFGLKTSKPKTQVMFSGKHESLKIVTGSVEDMKEFSTYEAR